MASTASSSARPAIGAHDTDSLPRKVGELGWPAAGQDASSTTALTEQAPESDITEQVQQSSSVSERSQATPAPSATAAASTISLPSTVQHKRKGILVRLTSSHAPPLVYGLHGPSVIRFAIIVLSICATITGWVLTAIHLSAAGVKNDDNNTNTLQQMAGTMSIFIHVAFAVAVLIEIIFLERAVFQLRAERWLHLHPGETLPLNRGGRSAAGSGPGGLNLAPWNRPSLPTYAAALGYRGTGDVEDDAIIAPPPPAYGNTRGSVLLLAGALRRFSSRTSNPNQWLNVQQVPDSRPASYVSARFDGEVRDDAARARELEHTLAQLEHS